MAEECKRFPSPPPPRPPLTSALTAASESKLKANLGCWAKSFRLESQIEYLSLLTAGICIAASVRLSVGEVAFLEESRVHPPSAGWWKFRFSFGKGCCAKQQRPVPRTAHKSELKLHFQSREIFTSWQQHTFQNGSLLDLALLREAISYLFGCACRATLWDQLHVKYQKRETLPFPKYNLLTMKNHDKKLSVGFLPFVGFIEAIAALKHLPNHSTLQFWLSVY